VGVGRKGEKEGDSEERNRGEKGSPLFWSNFLGGRKGTFSRRKAEKESSGTYDRGRNEGGSCRVLTKQGETNIY